MFWFKLPERDRRRCQQMSANQIGDQFEPLVRVPPGIGDPGTLDLISKWEPLQPICELPLAQKDEGVKVRDT